MVRPSPEAAIFIMIAIGTNPDRQQAQQGQPSSAAAEYGRAHERETDASRTPEGTGYWKVRVHRHPAPLLFPSKSGYVRRPPAQQIHLTSRILYVSLFIRFSNLQHVDVNRIT